MEPWFFLKSQIRMDPRQRRPEPPQLFPADMALVVEGVVDALDLHHVIE
jgi:hypothetical protein